MTSNPYNNLLFVINCLSNLNSIEEKINPNEIILYPNPARDIVFIDVPFISQTEIIFRIYNTYGDLILEQVVESISEDETRFTLNTSNYSKGVYLIRFFGRKNGEIDELNSRILIIN